MKNVKTLKKRGKNEKRRLKTFIYSSAVRLCHGLHCQLWCGDVITVRRISKKFHVYCCWRFHQQCNKDAVSVFKPHLACTATVFSFQLQSCVIKQTTA